MAQAPQFLLIFKVPATSQSPCRNSSHPAKKPIHHQQLPSFI